MAHFLSKESDKFSVRYNQKLDLGLKYFILISLVSFILFFIYKGNDEKKIILDFQKRFSSQSLQPIAIKINPEEIKLFNDPNLRKGMERLLDSNNRSISSADQSQVNGQEEEKEKEKIDLSNFALSLKNYSLKEKRDLLETLKEEIGETTKTYSEMEAKDDYQEEVIIQKLLQTQQSQLEILEKSIKEPEDVNGTI